MQTIINNLANRAISPQDVRSDGSLTTPRSFGVYKLPLSVSGTRRFRFGTRRFRFGNHPVRLHELEREFGSCKLLHLFQQRADAIAMASAPNELEIIQADSL